MNIISLSFFYVVLYNVLEGAIWWAVMYLFSGRRLLVMHLLMFVLPSGRGTA
jgi:hypothetical protein